MDERVAARSRSHHYMDMNWTDPTTTITANQQNKYARTTCKQHASICKKKKNARIRKQTNNKNTHATTMQKCTTTKQTSKQTSNQANNQPAKQASKQTNEHTQNKQQQTKKHKQTNKQTNNTNKQATKQTNKERKK